MKAYKAENGELPPSLANLVPQYIDAVPRDPFDGQPMRYSPEKMIIYSIGGDLKDSGGCDEGSGMFVGEPTYRIKF